LVTKKLDIFIPIRKPILHFEEKWFPYFNLSINELLEFINNTSFPDEFYPINQIRAQVYDEYDSDKRLADNWRKNELTFKFNLFCFLHLEIPYSITPEYAQQIRKWNPDHKFTKKDIHELMLHGLSAQIEKLIRDFFIAQSIAKPGSIFATGPALIFDKDTLVLTTAKLWNGLHEAKEHIAKIGWPIFGDLNLSDVWNWMQKSFPNETVSTRITRAIAAYSYLFVESSVSSDTSLIWAVMGVEALYTTGNTGLLNQIKDKSALILGEPKKYKNKLSAMYAFRSKLIHGSADLPRQHYQPEIDNKFDREYGESSDLATAILVCTFQYLVKNNIHEFEFNYTLK